MEDSFIGFHHLAAFSWGLTGFRHLLSLCLCLFCLSFCVFLSLFLSVSACLPLPFSLCFSAHPSFSLTGGASVLPEGSLFSKKEAPGAACALQTWVWKSQNSTLSHSVSQEVTGMARGTCPTSGRKRSLVPVKTEEPGCLLRPVL